jgi:hypothetical protein
MPESEGRAEPAAHGRGEPTGARSTVWMVSLKTGLAGRKGRVWLEPGLLVFRPDSDRFGDTRIALEHVRRVKAARFTPVLDLRLVDPDLPPRMGFYFVAPPSLQPIEKQGIQLQSPRRRAQRDAATALRDANPFVREEVKAWVERIRRAKRQS